MKRIGAHFSVSKGYLKAAEKASAWETGTFQFFSTNPRSFSTKTVDAETAQAAQAFVAAHDLKPVSHAPYVYNLSATKDDLWNLTIDLVVSDLRAAEAYGALYTVVHCGKHVEATREEGWARMITAVDRILAAYTGPVQLLLENTAGQGSELGTTIAELRDILDRVEQPERLGFCLDTCHAFAAGELSREDPGAWAAQVGRLLPGKVPVLHVNDSKAPFGSHKDRHELLGQGELGLEAIAAVVKRPEFAEAVVILEVPIDHEDQYADEIALLRQQLAS